MEAGQLYQPVGERFQPMSARRGEMERVLICDDEARLGALTAGLLSEFGFQPTAVAGGDEALELLRTGGGGAMSVVLLDVNLASGPSATEVLERMDAEGFSLPVVLTSGFALEDVPRALIEHHSVASYLAKPYTVEQLVAAIAGAATARVSDAT